MTIQTVAPVMLPTGARILVLQLQQLGDSLAVAPTIRALQRAYPGASIDVLTRATADIYGDWPLVRRRHIVVGGPSFGHELLRWAHMLYTIRRERYDCVLACTNQISGRYGVIARLTGAKNRIGFEGGRGSRFFTRRLARDPARSCYVENLDLARALGAQVRAVDARPADIWNHGMTLVAADNSFVALHAGSTWQSKLWYPERWAALADRLAVEGYVPTFIGVPREDAAVERIRALMRERSISLVGHTSVAQLAALLRRAALFVGTDSGPRHVAAAAGCPSVTVMSAQDEPERWRVPHADAIELRSAPPCAGCLRSRCVHRQCLEVIAVQQVLDACHALLPPNSTGVVAEEFAMGVGA